MKEWLRKNCWNLISLVIGVTGLLLGYLFYKWSLKEAGVTYLEVKSQIQVLNYSAVSGSNVRLIDKTGNEVKGNVFVTQLYIWNSGDLSIRRNLVLKQLKVKSQQPVELLDIKPLKLSRPEITETKLELRGQDVFVDFTIWEPGDGLWIQILYSAEKPVRFALEGTIEGVKNIVSGSDQFATAGLGLSIIGLLNVLGIIALVIGAIAAAAAGLDWLATKIIYPKFPRLKKIIPIIFLAGFSVIFAWAVIKAVVEQSTGRPDYLVPIAIR